MYVYSVLFNLHSLWYNLTKRAPFADAPNQNIRNHAQNQESSQDRNVMQRICAIHKTPLLTADMKCPSTKVQEGNQQAREQMIATNLRLVVKIAHEYNHFGLPLLDLVEETLAS